MKTLVRFLLLLALPISISCSSGEEEVKPEIPENPQNPGSPFPKEVIISASSIQRITFQSDYEPFLFVGTTDWIVIEFSYEGKKYRMHTETPNPADSAKKVNTITSVTPKLILDTTKVAVLDSIISSNWGLWGVKVKNYNPFTVTVNVLPETNNKLPGYALGDLKKMTFNIEPDIPFHVVRNGKFGDHKFYAGLHLGAPDLFPKTLNSLMTSYTKAPRHSVTYKID